MNLLEKLKVSTSDQRTRMATNYLSIIGKAGDVSEDEVRDLRQIANYLHLPDSQIERDIQAQAEINRRRVVADLLPSKGKATRQARNIYNVEVARIKMEHSQLEADERAARIAFDKVNREEDRSRAEQKTIDDILRVNPHLKDVESFVKMLSTSEKHK